MLQLKLNKVSMSADGTTLVVQDGTGAYNSVSNPTGYGTPNRAISTNIILRFKLFNSSNWIVIPGVTGSSLGTGVSIDTTVLGMSASPQLLPEGVEFIQYLGLYSKGANMGVTAGSNKVTMGSFSLTDFIGINYIAFGSNLNQIYQITSRTSTYLLLDQPYMGTLTSEVAYDAQNGDCYNLVQTYCNQQLDNKMAAVCVEQLFGTKLEKRMDLLIQLFIAQARFENTDYYGADLIMQNLFTELLLEDDCSRLY
jgi:hypothetical protein